MLALNGTATGPAHAGTPKAAATSASVGQQRRLRVGANLESFMSACLCKERQSFSTRTARPPVGAHAPARTASTTDAITRAACRARRIYRTAQRLCVARVLAAVRSRPAVLPAGPFQVQVLCNRRQQ